MNTKKFLIGSLIGGGILFLLGALFYVALLGSIFETHSSSAGNYMKDPPDMLFIILVTLQKVLCSLTFS